MKILDIAQSYPSENKKDFGGIFIHRQFRTLTEQGWDIRVINPQGLLYRRLKGASSEYPRFSVRDGIATWRPRHLWFPKVLNSSGRLLEFLYWRSIRNVVPQVLTDWKPDVVLADWIVPGGYAAFKISQDLRLPLVLRARGHDVKIVANSALRGGYLSRYYKKILDNASRIICQGSGLYDELLRSNLVDESKLQSLTNGIDTSIFRPAQAHEKSELRRKLDLPKNQKIITFVGRWEVEKGTRELCNALVNPENGIRNAFFLCLGPCHDEATKRTLQARLADRVRFEGAVEPSHLADYLRASDIFVLPSYREGLPNSMLEAMACGLPVVVTPVGGIPAIVRNGENGFIVPSKDPRHLANVLGDLVLRDRPEIGREARRTISTENLSFETVLEELKKALLDVSLENWSSNE